MDEEEETQFYRRKNLEELFGFCETSYICMTVGLGVRTHDLRHPVEALRVTKTKMLYTHSLVWHLALHTPTVCLPTEII